MHPDYRRELLKLLTDLDQQIREAEDLSTVPDDDVLLRASRCMADLKEQRRKVEEKFKPDD